MYYTMVKTCVMESMLSAMSSVYDVLYLQCPEMETYTSSLQTKTGFTQVSSNSPNSGMKIYATFGCMKVSQTRRLLVTMRHILIYYCQQRGSLRHSRCQRATVDVLSATITRI